MNNFDEQFEEFKKAFNRVANENKVKNDKCHCVKCRVIEKMNKLIEKENKNEPIGMLTEMAFKQDFTSIDYVTNNLKDQAENFLEFAIERYIDAYKYCLDTQKLKEMHK